MIENLASVLLLAVVLAGIAWLIIRLLSRSYVKTTATTAFVRTGGLRGAASEPTVVINGAAWVFGFLHRIKWVSLETLSIEVRHLDENALITTDPQYVDLEARFFVKVAHDRDNISVAARTIGGEMVNEASVRRLVEPKINGAVRDVAATFSLRDLLEKRMDFIAQVQARLRDDLAENGLALESVSILILRPTLQGQFSTDDVLGAQVARANAVVIEEALTEKTRLERLGALDRARLDADAERQQLSIQEEIDIERAQRERNVMIVRAEEAAAARIAQEQRREEAERAKLIADRALEEEQLENQRLIVLLQEQMQKAVELEKILREEAIAMAEQERERHVLEATIEKLKTTREQIEADRDREQALQAAMRVIETAAAEREAEIELINTRLDVDKRALEARGEIEIASAQGDAIRTRAEAELDATKLGAQGEREKASAAGLADVQIALERVKVLQAEADAIRQKLIAEAEGEKAKAEAWASHDAVAKEMEIARLNAETLKTIETARAQALGEAISGMNMNLFGDSNTAHRLLQLISMAKASGNVYDALPAGAQDLLGGIAHRVGAASDDAIPALLSLIENHYPELITENSTLRQAAEEISGDERLSSRARAVVATMLENPALAELPIQSIRALVNV
jgi:uncharacterized membrane protein YqiK